MKYLSDIGMVDLVSTTEFIVQITQLHKIDSSQTSAASSGQHRDADIKVISKWHIFCRLYRCWNLSDIEWRCFGNQIPSYFCRFHIGCYIGLAYSIVEFKTIQKWHVDLGLADTNVHYRWLISCPQRNCIVFISFDSNRHIGPTQRCIKIVFFCKSQICWCSKSISLRH